MRIVWFSWKDISHPQAGGAEVVSDNIRRQLVASGHEVYLFTAQYEESLPEEVKDGVKIFRKGSRYSVYRYARRKYRSLNLRPDVVIDEMNTLPFFTPLFLRKKKTLHFLLTYQLARQVWFYQMVFPFSILGFLIEPLYVWFLKNKYDGVLTESQSTKAELLHYGYNPEKVHVFRIGMELTPIPKIKTKPKGMTILFFGALRPMKRPIDAIKAFEISKDQLPDIKLIIAGNDDSSYAKTVKKYAENSRYKNSISIVGKVSTSKKLSLMRESLITLVTSVKEGWGLIVTEANSQGTPAIAYNVDGLRDSIVDHETGLLSEANPADMATKVCELINNKAQYEDMREQAHEHSRQFTFKNSYHDFLSAILKESNEKKD